MKILSKTDLMRNQICPTKLALDKQENPLKDRSKDESLHSGVLSHYRREGGYQIEDIAEQMFEGIQKSTLFGVKGLLETQSLVFGKVPAVSQASAQSSGNYARADILAKMPQKEVNLELRNYMRENYRSSYGGYHALYEVKSTTTVKKDHIVDLAFQTHVFESSAYKIGKTFVITVKKDFERTDQEINPSHILEITDVTDRVLNELPNLKEKINSAHSTLNQSEIPSSTIYKQCNHNKADTICPHIAYCPNWSNLDAEKTPIFYLPFLSQKKQDQYAEDNIMYIEDIDPGDKKLTKTQTPVVLAHKQDQPLIKLDKIQEFLDQVDTNLPISFLDFETFTKVIPEIGHKPYQLIPILSSTGILYPTNHLVRHDFIETSMPSNSRFFAESLIRNIDSIGSIFSWYMQFEKSVIKQLIHMNPDLDGELNSICDRMLDLRDPFSKGYYVDRGFEGTTKLKKVGHILTQDLSYNGLEVDNGSMVGDHWYEMINSDDIHKKNTIITNLQKYCSLDTTSLVRIYQFLKDLT